MAGRINKNARQQAARSTRTARSRNSLAPRNGREKKMFVTIAILAAVLIGTIGVAVAAFSTDLYIRGTATVRSTVWDIHFANLQPAVLTGAARELTAPTIQTSVDGNQMAAIKTYDVELKNAGDSVEYVFDVVNAGDINAVLNAIMINTGSSLSCSSLAGQSVADTVCAHLNYTLTYTDGTPVAVGDTLDKAVNSVPTSKTMKLKLQFDPSVTSDMLPSKDVTISGLAVSLSYGQETTSEN